MVKDLTKNISLRNDKAFLIIRWAIIIFFVALLTAPYYIFEFHRDLFLRWIPWFRFQVIFEFKYNLHGILLCIPFVYIAFTSKWRATIVVWLLSLIIIFPYILYFNPTFWGILMNLILISIPLLILTIVKLELMWKERWKNIMLERDAERQAYLVQIFKTQEEERKRIAHELHDETTQTLIAIANYAQQLIGDEYNNNDIENEKKKITWIRDTALNASESIRRLSLDLRPGILDLGLLPALTWLCDRSNEEKSIDARLSTEGEPRKLSSEIDLVIFRFVQEALNNVRRHSQATKLMVNVLYQPDSITVSIKDNGKGFHVPETLNKLSTQGKLGILGMQERAKMVGGKFDIYSEPGEGTSVSLKIPI